MARTNYSYQKRQREIAKKKKKAEKAARKAAVKAGLDPDRDPNQQGEGTPDDGPPVHTSKEE